MSKEKKKEKPDLNREKLVSLNEKSVTIDMTDIEKNLFGGHITLVIQLRKKSINTSIKSESFLRGGI